VRLRGPDINLKKGECMASKRHYNSLFSVFDLTIHKALGLPESVSIRVMLTYDRARNERKFVILKAEIPKEMQDRLTSWLEENVETDDIAYGLRANILDADRFSNTPAPLEFLHQHF
jgi:hypothetical protein